MAMPAYRGKKCMRPGRFDDDPSNFSPVAMRWVLARESPQYSEPHGEAGIGCLADWLSTAIASLSKYLSPSTCRHSRSEVLGFERSRAEVDFWGQKSAGSAA